MLDVDGSGGISLKEAVVLVSWMLGGTIRNCDGCGKYINPLMDEGYRCATCEVTDERHDVFDLCSSCYADKSCWPAHEHHLESCLVRSSRVGPYPALPVMLGNPVPCDCCGEEHDLVASYLTSTPDLDVHMRPLIFTNPTTGGYLSGKNTREDGNLASCIELAHVSLFEMAPTAPLGRGRVQTVGPQLYYLQLPFFL